MPVVWIVEDEKTYREKARAIVAHTAADADMELHLIEWDGHGPLSDEQQSKPADLVILDLNLSHGISGLNALRKIPGFHNRHKDRLHPYVIIWSHFDGELEVDPMPRARDLKFHFNPDRVFRTYWKAETNLETALQGFLSRMKEEGVYHG